jgi:hypothetical protein
MTAYALPWSDGFSIRAMATTRPDGLVTLRRQARAKRVSTKLRWALENSCPPPTWAAVSVVRKLRLIQLEARMPKTEEQHRQDILDVGS